MAGFNTLSPLSSEGDFLYYHSSANTRLGVGTNGQCLTSNGTDPVWGACGGSLTNPMTTLGDLLYEGASGAAIRLAGNTSTTPMYLKSLGASGAATAPTLAQIQFSDIVGTLGIGAGGTGQTTAAAAFNALSPLTTEGDLPYYQSASNARLAIGGANTFLTSNGSDPAWGSLTGAGFGSQPQTSSWQRRLGVLETQLFAPWLPLTCQLRSRLRPMSMEQIYRPA